MLAMSRSASRCYSGRRRGGGGDLFLLAACCRRSFGGKAKTAANSVAQASASFDDFLAFIEKHDSLTVLTGAGVSTESNIPDYRGPHGAYTTGFKPVMHQKFVSDESQRERYWGRSYWGWETFSKSRPNACHAALSHLEKLGKVRSIITQNVDRLHQMAGSKRVLELHGTTWVVTCLEPECDYKVGREKFQQTLLSMNPQIVEKEKLRHHANGDSKYSVGNDVDGDSAVRLNVRAMEHTPGLTRPDGDVEVELQETFHYPSCPRCGPEKGVLKPDVTFFGDNVPKQRVKLAYDRVAESDALLVIGSSLMVFSAFRLATFARDLKIPIAVLNQGETRIDSFEGLVKHEAPIGETMAKILKCISL